jgi:hypothetical protein
VSKAILLNIMDVRWLIRWRADYVIGEVGPASVAEGALGKSVHR